METLTGAHIFVDETKSRDYIMAATMMLPKDVSAARKELQTLLLPGQERLHFTHERNARRGQISDRFRFEEDPPEYRHLRAKNEPLLWISDAVAWCHQRGGEWQSQYMPLVSEIRVL